MKNFAGIVVLVVVVAGCNLSKYLNAPENINAPKAVPSSTPKPAPTDTPKPSTPAPPSLEAVFRKNVGKYPYEIKLLENAELKARLKKLMGNEYSGLAKNWSVESPIEIESGIAKTTGCEAHNCGGNQYYMFFDLKNDDINIYHIVDEQGTKHFYEKGEISLPKKFADDLGTDQDQ